MRQTDTDESKNVSRSFVVLTRVDLAHSAEDHVTDEVVLDHV